MLTFAVLQGGVDDRLDIMTLACLRVYRSLYCTYMIIAFAQFIAVWSTESKAFDGSLTVHAQHRIKGARHARIGNITGSLGQNSSIIGRNMRMGAYHDRNFAI